MPTRVAGAVAALLSLVTAVLALLGVLFTPLLIALIAPGFTGAKRDLTITLVPICFPGVGLLVLSAWCLGILNSHHRFLLSYSAPILCNVADDCHAGVLGRGHAAATARDAASRGDPPWAALLQFAVQLPDIRALVPDLRLHLDLSEHVRAAVRNFLPVFVSRGIVQISAYVDALLASLLPTGAVTGLANAPAALHVTGESVRDVRFSCRAAGHVQRRRP